MLVYMKILVEIDEAMAREIERIAPGRERQRSEFIRRALRRALDQIAEERIAAGYRAEPQQPGPPLDARVWGEWDVPAAPKAAKPRAPARKKRGR